MEKQIKLRKINRMKYCLNCEKIVEIVMKGLEGYCPFCGKKLFTMEKILKNEN